ncbi:MAG: hypothetical protein J5594_00800 [Elusimicrobiaceae bacterium]|nr:hypothetical protein [Elusimicrobiaceae bacterium]
MENVAAVLGLFVFTAIAYAFSTNRKAINWKTIAWAFGLQVIFAVLILQTSAGKAVFNWLNDVVIKILAFQQAGAEMVFGNLAKADSLGYIFAFQVLPTIIFFSALISLLYYLGIMQWVVYVFAVIIGKTCKLSGAESLSAAANIFVGQTEAPLLIKPYVEKMTKSELMCVMTGGMATVAGGVMMAYVSMLKDTVPGIAGHLIAASLMGAPAGVMFSKLLVPETEKPVTGGNLKISYKDPSANILEAISNGTTTGVFLAINVAGMLIAFTALIALCNGALEWITGLFLSKALSMQQLFAYIFSPLTWLMGVNSSDVLTASQLVGEKTVLNEFIAYANFAKILNGHTIELSLRTKVILSYALCGFANFSSIGIQIGGIGSIAPSRRGDLSRLGFRALLAGLFSSCTRAILAGLLIG